MIDIWEPKGEREEMGGCRASLAQYCVTPNCQDHGVPEKVDVKPARVKMAWWQVMTFLFLFVMAGFVGGIVAGELGGVLTGSVTLILYNRYIHKLETE